MVRTGLPGWKSWQSESGGPFFGCGIRSKAEEICITIVCGKKIVCTLALARSFASVWVILLKMIFYEYSITEPPGQSRI